MEDNKYTLLAIDKNSSAQYSETIEANSYDEFWEQVNEFKSNVYFIRYSFEVLHDFDVVDAEEIEFDDDKL